MILKNPLSTLVQQSLADISTLSIADKVGFGKRLFYSGKSPIFAGFVNISYLFKEQNETRYSAFESIDKKDIFYFMKP